MRAYWEKTKLPFVADMAAERVWYAVGWAEKNGDIPMYAPLQSVTGWSAAWRGNRSAWTCVEIVHLLVRQLTVVRRRPAAAAASVRISRSAGANPRRG